MKSRLHHQPSPNFKSVYLGCEVNIWPAHIQIMHAFTYIQNGCGKKFCTPKFWISKAPLFLFFWIHQCCLLVNGVGTCITSLLHPPVDQLWSSYMSSSSSWATSRFKHSNSDSKWTMEWTVGFTIQKILFLSRHEKFFSSFKPSAG